MENIFTPLPPLPQDYTDSEPELPSDYDEEADSGIDLGSLDSISEFELASEHQMVSNSDVNVTDPSYIPSEPDSIDNSDVPEDLNILEVTTDGHSLKYLVQMWVDGKDLDRLAKYAVEEPCSSEVSLEDVESFSI